LFIINVVTVSYASGFCTAGTCAAKSRVPAATADTVLIAAATSTQPIISRSFAAATAAHEITSGKDDAADLLKLGTVYRRMLKGVLSCRCMDTEAESIKSINHVYHT